MPNAELKTKKTKASVAGFIAALEDVDMRADARTLIRLMSKATGAAPRLWGSGMPGSMVGFGDVHLKYSSGRELDWFATGFAPRKGMLSIYLSCGAAEPAARRLFAMLGPHKMGAGCLSIKRLADVDEKALAGLIELATRHSFAMHEAATSAPRAQQAARKAKNAARAAPKRRTAAATKRGTPLARAKARA